MNSKLLRPIACIVALSFALPGPASAEQTYSKQIAKAREYFALLQAKKYDECVAASNETMKSALPADKLREAWEGVVGMFGEYQAEVRASASPVKQYVSVLLVSKFEHSMLDVRVTFDDDLKVAGLFFTPSSEGVEYQPPAYVDTSKFREEEVTVNAGEFPLAGTLSIPTGNGPFPAVVLVHGSGPHDQDETIFLTKPFKDLAWGLSSRGIMVLRYEKRTKKYGAAMNPTTITIDSETVDDAVAAAQLLLARKDVRSNGVFVAGHSLGATAAPYIGSKEPRIAGLIMLAAAARPIYQLVLDQVTYIANVDGVIDDDEQKQIDETADAVNKLRDGSWKPGDTLLGAPAEYWIALNKMDPVGYAEKYDRPMLIMQGGRDYQVTDKDLDIWKRELASRANVTIRPFPKLDHLFHTGPGPSVPADYQKQGYVDPAVIETIADWIKSQ